ncbi:hypothetical protein OCGS_0505 [Oceaniovalibus guishaninsula JLT2003]|uniref:Uncharacterized protein n=1 Tax=Oceaniovalibus guishaninsula JLT2003 TaxID=1231392 RepID=K2I8Q2_9RHOB|nr:hypothetical protein [Oceaniovalibus guishaninsula]EKE45415.1 hypothetical protein OCGS_0505 [Oceaniovalibus guishaninsula JLT2003]
MILELVAVITAGVGAGGVVLLVRRIVPPLPRWLMPVVAGAAMLAVSISLEYSWFPRTEAALPQGVEVASQRQNRAFWRPWTYAVPFVDGFIAVDRAGILRNDAAEGQRLANLYVFGRWTPTRRMRAVFDCAGRRRADLTSADAMGEDGIVAEHAWRSLAPDDAVAAAVCEGG